MSADDQFTSIQWDRDEVENTNTSQNDDSTKEVDETLSINFQKLDPSNEGQEQQGQEVEVPVVETQEGESQEKEGQKWEGNERKEEENKDLDIDSTASMLVTLDSKDEENKPQEREGVNKPESCENDDTKESHIIEPAQENSSVATVESISSAGIGIQNTNLHKATKNQPNSENKSPTLDSQSVGQSVQNDHSGFSEGSLTDYKLITSVTDPLRDMDAQKPFISYLVTTVTNNPSILKISSMKIEEDNGDSVVKIRRRYGDFRFLYDCLNNDYPQLLVPPLPSKSNFKYLTGDTFSSEFVHRRLNSLDRFVRFLSQHKDFSKSKVFHLFLSDSADWATFQKNLKITKNGGFSPTEENGTSLPSVVNKVVNEELLTETIMNFLTPSKHKRENNKEIIEISDRLKKLYENLIKLDRIFSKLNKKEFDLRFDYNQFSTQITKLSNIYNPEVGNDELVTENNDDKQQQNNGTFKTSSDSQVTANFKVFADSLSYFSENWAELHKYIDESFLVALKDCAKYIISLTNLIQLQHNKKIDLQVLQDYLAKAKQELAGLTYQSPSSNATSQPNPASNSGGLVTNTTQLIKDTISTGSNGQIGSVHTENKKLKLQNRVEQLEAEIEAQSQLVKELTNKIIYEEYPYWDKFNKTELKNTMVELCDKQISFYSGLASKWSSAEMKLLNRLQELS